MEQSLFDNESDDEKVVNVVGGANAQALEAQDVGFVGRLFGMLHAPSKSFAVINNKWDWLLAILIFVTLGFGAINLQKTYLMPEVKRAALENIEKFKDSIGAEQYAEMRESIPKDIETNFQLSPKTFLIGITANIVFALVIGLVCWVVGNFAFGGKAKFWQVVSIVVFAGIISLIHDYVRGGLMVMNETSYVYLGLGLLKPDPDGSFAYYLLRQMEFITMWKLAAISVALGALYNISTSKFIYVLLPIWLLGIALIAFANGFAGGTIVY